MRVGEKKEDCGTSRCVLTCACRTVMGKQSLYGQVAGGHDAKEYEAHHGVPDLKAGFKLQQVRV